MEYGVPYTYRALNVKDSRRVPASVHVNDSQAARYYRRYLLQKAYSVFKWELPDGWSRDYLLHILYSVGYIAIIYTHEFGAIPQQAAISGYNVFYQPNTVTVVNPLLPGMHILTIDKDCTLLRLQPDYGGLYDMVEYYAGMMALAAEAVNVNLLNSKMAYTFAVPNKAAAETVKKLYDKIAEGEPAVVYDKELLGADGKPCWQLFTQNVGQNYIVSDLLSDMRKIEAMFDTEIGIPNANTDKRERLVTDEVNANNVETATKAALWLEQLQAGCKRASAMFKIKLSVDWRADPTEGGEKDAGSTVNHGAVSVR